VPQIRVHPLDLLIAELADRQHGVVALVQLSELGLSARAVRARVAAGRLHRVYRGVYAVGRSNLTAHGRWMSAVLACGQGAVLSHSSAAALHGIRPSASAKIEVTVPRPASYGPTGVQTHERLALTPADVTLREAIPCVSAARALLDLAERLDDDVVASACTRAEQLKMFDGRAIDELLERNHGARGTARLRRVTNELDPRTAHTRQELERRFLLLCRSSGLPAPLVNASIALDDHTFVPDFLWPAQRLIAETDGYQTHGTREAFERDRRRDQLLDAAGYRTLRFTWRQLRDEPDRVAQTLRARLGRADNRTVFGR
jgi:predicted transcriptional regulator of viral defense system